VTLHSVTAMQLPLLTTRNEPAAFFRPGIYTYMSVCVCVCVCVCVFARAPPKSASEEINGIYYRAHFMAKSPRLHLSDLDGRVPYTLHLGLLLLT
jgi:hypothetical protein